MKKILVMLSLLVVLTGCSLMSKPKEETKAFLERYQLLDEGVIKDLEESAKDEGLSNENSKTYVDAVKREYKDMKFEILSENVNGNEATVRAKVIVYDLYKAKNDASEYLKDHTEEFYENETYNEELFLKYQLDKMLKTNTTVEYTIDINLTKIDNKWIVNELDNTTKEKIHGLYNYINE